MPSKSPAQAKMMKAVANNPKFAKQVKIPQSVGTEYEAADQRDNRGGHRHPASHAEFEKLGGE